MPLSHPSTPSFDEESGPQGAAVDVNNDDDNASLTSYSIAGGGGGGGGTDSFSSSSSTTAADDDEASKLISPSEAKLIAALRIAVFGLMATAAVVLLALTAMIDSSSTHQLPHQHHASNSHAVDEVGGDDNEVENDDKRFANLVLVVSTIGVVVVALALAAFAVMDAYVRRRQRKLLSTAVRTTQLISSLFPAGVRDRLLRQDEEDDDRRPLRLSSCSEDDDDDANDNAPLDNTSNHHGGRGGLGKQGRRGSMTFLRDSSSKSTSPNTSYGWDDDDSFDGGKKPNNNNSLKPIADLFPNTTVLFCDIAGFTGTSNP